MIGTMSQQWVARVAGVGATVGASWSSEWTDRPTAPTRPLEPVRQRTQHDNPPSWLD